MSTANKVAVLVGSLRKDSFNRRVAKALVELAPSSLHFHSVTVGSLPHYDQDRDTPGDVPSEWSEFRSAVKDADAVLFVTPEYNRSVPGVLKNAIDVGSRPY